MAILLAPLIILIRAKPCGSAALREVAMVVRRLNGRSESALAFFRRKHLEIQKYFKVCHSEGYETREAGD